MPDYSLPGLLNFIAQDPFLCIGITVGVCAALYGLFDLDRQSGGFWLTGDFDGDGGGD